MKRFHFYRSPRYWSISIIFDDKFTSVKPTTETEHIKIWTGLSKTNKLQADLSYDLELDDITWQANNYKKSLRTSELKTRKTAKKHQSPKLDLASSNHAHETKLSTNSKRKSLDQKSSKMKKTRITTPSSMNYKGNNDNDESNSSEGVSLLKPKI